MVQAVVARLGSDARLQIVGTADSATNALAVCEREQPDVVIVDLSMPGGGGIELLAGLHGVVGAPKVLVLSTFDDPATVRAAISDGAAGYLHKSSPLTDLADRVVAVAGGQLVLDSVSSSALAVAVQADAVTPRLSDRELAVLRLIAEGNTNAGVAAALHLSPSTAKTYLDRIFSKLDVRDRAAAVGRAKDLGLI